jgi:hypothetical protein
MDIKQISDRKVTENKQGTLTNGEIQLLVKEIQDCRRGNKLDLGTAEREMAAMQKKIER